MVQWVPCLSKFLFFSMFAGRFSYLANNFHLITGTVGSSFSPGSPEVGGFASVYAALHSEAVSYRFSNYESSLPLCL